MSRKAGIYVRGANVPLTASMPTMSVGLLNDERLLRVGELGCHPMRFYRSLDQGNLKEILNKTADFWGSHQHFKQTYRNYLEGYLNISRAMMILTDDVQNFNRDGLPCGAITTLIN